LVAQAATSGGVEPALLGEHSMEQGEGGVEKEEEGETDVVNGLNPRPMSSSRYPVPERTVEAMRLLGVARPDSAVVLSKWQPAALSTGARRSVQPSPPSALPAAAAAARANTKPTLPEVKQFEPYRSPEGVLPFRGVSVTADVGTQTRPQLVGPAHARSPCIMSGCEGYGVHDVCKAPPGGSMQKRRTVLFLHAWSQTDLPDLSLSHRRRPRPSRDPTAGAATDEHRHDGVTAALVALNHVTSQERRAAPGVTAADAVAAAVRLGRQRADFYRPLNDPVGRILQRRAKRAATHAAPALQRGPLTAVAVTGAALDDERVREAHAAIRRMLPRPRAPSLAASSSKPPDPFRHFFPPEARAEYIHCNPPVAIMAALLTRHVA
jgi:hypothetical protein